jgi:hypothetical protein
MTTTMTEEGVRLLAALRAASALRREPGTLTPTGHRQWFSLAELATEKRLPVDRAGQWLAAYECEARHLERTGLIKHRTQFTVTRYTLTSEGALELLRLDRAAGVSEIISCAMDLAQARYDVALAARNLQAAQHTMTHARVAHGPLQPGEGALYAALTDAEVTP